MERWVENAVVVAVAGLAAGGGLCLGLARQRGWPCPRDPAAGVEWNTARRVIVVEGAGKACWKSRCMYRDPRRRYVTRQLNKRQPRGLCGPAILDVLLVQILRNRRLRYTHLCSVVRIKDPGKSIHPSRQKRAYRRCMRGECCGRGEFASAQLGMEGRSEAHELRSRFVLRVEQGTLICRPDEA